MKRPRPSARHELRRVEQRVLRCDIAWTNAVRTGARAYADLAWRRLVAAQTDLADAQGRR